MNVFHDLNEALMSFAAKHSKKRRQRFLHQHERTDYEKIKKATKRTLLDVIV